MYVSGEEGSGLGCTTKPIRTTDRSPGLPGPHLPTQQIPIVVIIITIIFTTMTITIIVILIGIITEDLLC